MKAEKLIIEKSVSGKKAYSLPPIDVPDFGPEGRIPGNLLRESPPGLPEVSEPEVVRHYNALSRMNHGVDSGFYPLGSCTMKYNPKVNENIARLEGFMQVHPLQPEETVQGCLEILYRMDRMLSEITGMEQFSLQPAAGSHGELAGLMIIKAWHRSRGETDRDVILVPDSAHGTNPASAAVAGFKVKEVISDSRGNVDVKALEEALNERVAGLMLTNPNTLGLFEENICRIQEMVHQAGGLLYYDGANANAILGICRPGDMGFDVVHLNLHKTFSTPHGGGGPGSGPVGVRKGMEDFLPGPVVEYTDSGYSFKDDMPRSIGRVRAFHGNFAVILRACAYILTIGGRGLKEVSEAAVLNANYMMQKLNKYFELPYDRKCMHEFVLSGSNQSAKGFTTLDMAKRLLDFGYHPPTVYFPLIVKEALMVEPTETESRETLDEFIEVMKAIAEEAEKEPEKIKKAPYTTPVRRLDEVSAARNPVLKW